MSSQGGLTIDQADAIRVAFQKGMRTDDLAAEYGVHRSVILWLTGRHKKRDHPSWVDFTRGEIADIKQRGMDGYSAREVTIQYGLSPDNLYVIHQIGDVMRGRRRYRLYPEPPRWEPTCMSAVEFDEWRSLMETMTQPISRVPRPCDDCPKAWALAQRASGLCNGILPHETIQR